MTTENQKDEKEDENKEETFTELPNGPIQTNIQRIKSAVKNLKYLLPESVNLLRTITESIEEIEENETKK